MSIRLANCLSPRKEVCNDVNGCRVRLLSNTGSVLPNRKRLHTGALCGNEAPSIGPGRPRGQAIKGPEAQGQAIV